mmetsp:Transcript_14974/g.30615  ORF Transcript_14974/g.30615 Transcript_14974/m.30615 type:complete len:223 (+) Transcript_14974:239-907(+)
MVVATARMVGAALIATIPDTAINQREEEVVVKVPCLLVSAVQTTAPSMEGDVEVQAGTSATRITVGVEVQAGTTVALIISVAAALAPTTEVAEGEEAEAVEAATLVIRIAVIRVPAFVAREGIDDLPTTVIATIAVVVAGGNRSSWASIFRPWWIVWFVRVAMSSVNSASQEKATWRCFNLVRLSQPSSRTWLADGIYALPILFGIGSITSGLKRIPFIIIR